MIHSAPQKGKKIWYKVSIKKTFQKKPQLISLRSSNAELHRTMRHANIYVTEIRENFRQIQIHSEKLLITLFSYTPYLTAILSLPLPPHKHYFKSISSFMNVSTSKGIDTKQDN